MKGIIYDKRGTAWLTFENYPNLVRSFIQFVEWQLEHPCCVDMYIDYKLMYCNAVRLSDFESCQSEYLHWIDLGCPVPPKDRVDRMRVCNKITIFNN